MLKSCFASEPRMTALIFHRVYEDPMIRDQIMTMMSAEYIREVNEQKDAFNDLLDPNVPSHLRILHTTGRIESNQMQNYVKQIVEKNLEDESCGRFNNIYNIKS